MSALGALVRRRPSMCGGVAAALPAYVAGEAPLDPATRDHVGQCLRCQAEIARYRRMLRTLHALRQDASEPPPTVLRSILTGLEPQPSGPRPVVAVAALAAAAAVGGVGAALLLARRRGPRSIPLLG
jgi:anti-sigma factor RsiW